MQQIENFEALTLKFTLKDMINKDASITKLPRLPSTLKKGDEHANRIYPTWDNHSKNSIRKSCSSKIGWEEFFTNVLSKICLLMQMSTFLDLTEGDR